MLERAISGEHHLLQHEHNETVLESPGVPQRKEFKDRHVSFIEETGGSVVASEHEFVVSVGESPAYAAPGPAPVVVSLSDVQMLLDEIGKALAPAEELTAQDAERLDGDRVDQHAWRSLANALGLVRLRLSLLARVALTIGHGVGVADLLGESSEGTAASSMVEAFGMALAAATSAIAGGIAPAPRAAAKLELQLHDSALALQASFVRRQGPALEAAVAKGGMTSSDTLAMTAIVLADTAGTTLAALLSDAADVLAQAVVLAGRDGPGADVGCFDSDVETGAGHAGTTDSLSGAYAEGSSPKSSQSLSTPSRKSSRRVTDEIDLPDLTERLKKAGMYEEYQKWREGYMKWRTGSAAGAHGEITTETTT
eukprot:TRINITY_DN10891_c0_g1_i1.p1 TRINITY_DN10891_c0_g1~~TRINITY_DN10891_c0_g1_i1.p1  ORF type:complete len:368 (-),score=64.69 TRINITY_DN10891_c0_g1_i1:326-1429(-)